MQTERHPGLLSTTPLRSFAVSEPRRGGLILAQGKAVEAAALGKTPPHPAPFFPSGLASPKLAKPEGKKEEIILDPQPRAALRLGYYHIVPPRLQFGSLRLHSW